MSLDYRSALENQAWALLEADTPFSSAFLAGNRIKMSGDGWLRQKFKGAQADYPEIKIELRNGSQPTPPKVMAMNDTAFTSATCNMTIPLSQQLAVILTYAKLKTGNQSPLESIAEGVFWRKWPKFGLPYVLNFTMSTTRKEVTVKNTAMQQTTVLIAFQLRPLLSALSA